MVQKKCIFCGIVDGKEDSSKIFENEDIILLKPLKTSIIGKGHLLLIPKKHFSNLYDIQEDTLKDIMIFLKKISKILKDKLNVSGVNILHASGTSAQQSIGHFHIHIIPRWDNDGLDLWPKTSYVQKAHHDDIYFDLKKLLKN